MSRRASSHLQLDQKLLKAQVCDIGTIYVTAGSAHLYAASHETKVRVYFLCKFTDALSSTSEPLDMGRDTGSELLTC